MKISCLLLVFLNLSVYCYCQNPTMVILDSLVVYNQWENDVVPINVEINVDSINTDSLLLYGFGKVIYPDDFLINALELDCKGKENVGLRFIVEDGGGKMLRIQDLNFVSYTFWSTEKRKAATVHYLDENKLKLYDKTLGDDETNEYYGDKRILSLTDNKTHVTVYPVLLKELKPGKYKMFLYYSELDPKEGYSDNLFLGTIISNKIDLIVEDRPVRWWEFWKKKGKFGQ